MAATIATIAEAVKTLLTDTVTGAGGTIERVWDPEIDLRDLNASGAPRVTVVALTEEPIQAARGLWQTDYTISVGIRRKVGNTDAAVDSALELASTLSDYLARNKPAGVTVSISSVRLSANYAPVELKTMRVLTSVILVTYRKWAA